MTEAEVNECEEYASQLDCGRKLIAEVRRLREALNTYGQHGTGEDHRRCPAEFELFEVCTCGLDAALAGTWE